MKHLDIFCSSEGKVSFANHKIKLLPPWVFARCFSNYKLFKNVPRLQGNDDAARRNVIQQLSFGLLCALSQKILVILFHPLAYSVELLCYPALQSVTVVDGDVQSCRSIGGF